MTVAEIQPNNPALAGCMATVSGKIVNLFDLNPDDILLEDIAHGLAYNCRWNGHTSGFYSVAEHCLQCFNDAPEDLKLLALFHDSEEAYWGDMIRPLKMILKDKCPEILYRMIDTRIMILKKFGIEWDDRIKEIDDRQLQWDFENLIKDNRIAFKTMPPWAAETQWLKAAKVYLNIFN